jgi:hypothetical protein
MGQAEPKEKRLLTPPPAFEGMTHTDAVLIAMRRGILDG